MLERFKRFMYGRYGIDQFSKFLLVVSIVLLFISTIFRNGLLYLLALAVMIYLYIRCFSRNYEKRYAENNRYLKYSSKFRRAFATFKRDMKIRKTHHIYRCPNCRQKIKIPKNKGRISIRCPKCYTEFIKRS
ncbi:MAG: hypothetical protein SOV90_07155 [Lachnospiraceae bacterium]|nr:hypothetical protein [Clostridiales bacterium]MDD6293547.1 hypothetical protein [Eubacteriales bacterium]MDY2607678.1 hypothetical protein [Lachnospiraceae bacterium]MDY6329568.1 hypothetical protein [Lachnospiraceae bacterium]